MNRGHGLVISGVPDENVLWVLYEGDYDVVASGGEQTEPFAWLTMLEEARNQGVRVEYVRLLSAVDGGFYSPNELGADGFPVTYERTEVFSAQDAASLGASQSDPRVHTD